MAVSLAPMLASLSALVAANSEGRQYFRMCFLEYKRWQTFQPVSANLSNPLFDQHVGFGSKSASCFSLGTKLLRVCKLGGTGFECPF